MCVCVFWESERLIEGVTLALCPSYNDAQVHERQFKSAREIVRVCEWVMNSCYTFACVTLYGNFWPLCVSHLLLCFSVFWDLYCAAPDRRETCEHSSEAKAFHDYVSDSFFLLQKNYNNCLYKLCNFYIFSCDTHVNTVLCTLKGCYSLQGHFVRWNNYWFFFSVSNFLKFEYLLKK